MNTEEEKLIEALKTIEVPYLNSNLVDLESIKEIAFSDNTWTIELEFGFPIKTYKATVEKSIVEKLKDVEKLTLNQINKVGAVCSHSCKYYFYYRPESNFLSLAMSNMACSFTSIEKINTV